MRYHIYSNHHCNSRLGTAYIYDDPILGGIFKQQSPWKSQAWRKRLYAVFRRQLSRILSVSAMIH